ncbi:MAG: Ig-like domain-containing protein [Rhodospirillales bacterium]|nr:Ig-like domain-containing protein [Rhodospirillales bacterium]
MQLKFSPGGQKVIGRSPINSASLSVTSTSYVTVGAASTLPHLDIVYAQSTGAGNYTIPRFAFSPVHNGEKATYTSNNTAVATVDPVTGAVTPVAPGLLDISVTSGSGAWRVQQTLVATATAVTTGLSSVAPTSLLASLIAASNAVTTGVLPGTTAQAWQTGSGAANTANFLRRTVGAWTIPGGTTAVFDYFLAQSYPSSSGSFSFNSPGTPVTARHTITIGHDGNVLVGGNGGAGEYYAPVTGNTTVWTAAPSAGGVSSTVAADTFVPGGSRQFSGTPVMYRKPGEHRWRKDPVSGSLYAYGVQGPAYMMAYAAGSGTDGCVTYCPFAAYSNMAAVLPANVARYLPTASQISPVPVWVARNNPQSNWGNFTGAISGSTLTVSAVSAGVVSCGSILLSGTHPNDPTSYVLGGSVPVGGAIIKGGITGNTLTVGSVVSGAVVVGQSVFYNGDGSASLLWRDTTYAPLTVTAVSGNTVTLSGNSGSYGQPFVIPAGSNIALGFMVEAQLTATTFQVSGTGTIASQAMTGTPYTHLPAAQVEPVDIIGIAGDGSISYDYPNRYYTHPTLYAGRPALSTQQVWHGGDSGSLAFMNVNGTFVLLSHISWAGQAFEPSPGGGGISTVTAAMNQMATDWNADRVTAGFAAYNSIPADASAGTYALTAVNLAAFPTY